MANIILNIYVQFEHGSDVKEKKYFSGSLPETKLTHFIFYENMKD